METIFDFIEATESATKHLFAGLEYYEQLVDEIDTPMFVVDRNEKSFPMEEYNEWYEQHKDDILRAEEATNRYVAEIFAQNTLAGAILQIADKAIEIYSTNNVIPIHINSLIKPSQKKAIKFCIGPKIRGIPKGLIIHAGRNQHTHYNESMPHAITKNIFEELKYNNPVLPAGIPDGCFDLQINEDESKASNILHVLNWKNYDIFKQDLISLLEHQS